MRASPPIDHRRCNRHGNFAQGKAGIPSALAPERIYAQSSAGPARRLLGRTESQLMRVRRISSRSLAADGRSLDRLYRRARSFHGRRDYQRDERGAAESAFGALPPMADDVAYG